MKWLERILIALSIIAGLVFKYMAIVEHQAAAVAFIITHGLFVTLGLFYLFTIQRSVYSIALVLYVLMLAGVVFQFMHWPGGREMSLLGLLGNVLFAILLGITGAKFRETKYIPFYAFIIAGLLLLQTTFILLEGETFERYELLIHYPLVGMIGTVMITPKVRTIIPKAELKVMTLLLVVSLTAVLSILVGNILV